jgi:hypothetical protein
VDENSEGGFCVPPYETTECCASGDSIEICFFVDGWLAEAVACPAIEPMAEGACELQSECYYEAGIGSDIVYHCAAGEWRAEPCPDTLGPGMACESADRLCAQGALQCQCDGENWACVDCDPRPSDGDSCDDAEMFMTCYFDDGRCDCGGTRVELPVANAESKQEWSG